MINDNNDDFKTSENQKADGLKMGNQSFILHSF